jgi:Skp family chaperone for outer membrane proteins
MKRIFLILLITISTSWASQAQGKGIKIGFIDMEYILQNIPDYTEAKNQLEQKAQQWKKEIEVKKNDITKLKEALKAEEVLLTKELVEEKLEEIKFQETQLLDYQQKRFGPSGDLILQKAGLIKPIQDQIFTAVQDMAEAQKYDYIFDKSSDLSILFASKRLDISDRIVRVLTNSAKREQMSDKQLKAEELKNEKAVEAEAKLAQEEKKKIAAEAKSKNFEERKRKILEERAAAKKASEQPTKEN